MTRMSTWALAGVLSFLLAIGTTYLCRWVAPRVGAVSAPRKDRWGSRPIPMLGGVAILCGMSVSVALLPVLPPLFLVLFGGASALALVGLIDDLQSMAPVSKLTLQVAVASIVTAFGLRFDLTGVPVIDILATIFWLVTLTNAFNLLDNMDGLAAGIAVIAGSCKLALLLLDGDVTAAGPTAAFVGACLGFLVHNFSPARIFMGDAGSLFLGFFLAGLSTIGGAPDSRTTMSVLIVPLTIMLVPLFDTMFVTVVRALAGRSITQGGRDHTSHRLVTAGMSERRAVVLFYLLAGAAGAIAVATRGAGLLSGLALLTAMVLAMLILGVGLARVRVQTSEPSGDAAILRRLGPAAIHVRQAATAGIQLVLVLIAFAAAYAFRLGSQAGLADSDFLTALPLIIACKMLALAVFRTYRTVWRYTDSRDLLAIVQASTIGSIASIAAVALLVGLPADAGAVFALDWIFLTSMLAAARLSLRAIAEILHPLPDGAARVLIYGAGDTGVTLAHQIRQHHVMNRVVVGFIDDDVFKRGARVQGLPVFGDRARLEAIIRTHHVHEVIIASASLDADREDDLRAQCRRLAIPVTRFRMSATGFAIETDVA
jgi:UDP-GlcNAc:undecaprenyl-phosphate GlcNAc-1-phosphate transferase